MAVQSDTSRISYAGNNSTSTSYAVPFVFLENSHLKAIVRTAAGVESPIVLNNHTGAGDPNGGTVRTAIAIPATSTLTIYREVPITQTTTYAEGGDFPAASHERALDKLTTITQQLNRRIDTCVRGSEVTPVAPVPSPTGTQQFVLATTFNQPPAWQPQSAIAIGPVIATGSSEPRFVSDRFADSVNVKDFGAVGDGVADDAPSIQAAVSSGAKHVHIPAGTYKILSTISAPSGVSLTGDGISATLLDGSGATFANLTNGKHIIVGNATLTQLPALGTNAAKGDSTLTFSSTPSLAVGDVIVIYNPTDSSWNAARTYYRAGEFARVALVNGSTVTLQGRVVDDYLTSAVNVYKFTGAGSSHLANFSLKGLNATNTNSIQGIEFYRCVDSSIENVRVTNCSYIQIGFRQCFNMRASGVTCEEDFVVGAGGGTDYGLAITNSQNVFVSDSYFSATRHGVTVGGASSVGDVTNRFVRITSSYIGSTTGSNAADFHGNTEYASYDNCVIVGGVGGCGGDYIKITNNQILGPYVTNQVAIQCSEWRGCNFEFSSNYIWTNQDAGSNRGTFIDVGGNGNVIHSNTVKGGHIFITGNTLETSNSTENFQSTPVVIYQRGYVGSEPIYITIENNTIIAPPMARKGAILIRRLSGIPYECVSLCNNKLHGYGIYVYDSEASGTRRVAKNVNASGNYIKGSDGWGITVQEVSDFVSVTNNLLDNSGFGIWVLNNVGAKIEYAAIRDNTLRETPVLPTSSISTRASIYAKAINRCEIFNNTSVSNNEFLVVASAANFVAGDAITGSSSGATATVVAVSASLNHLYIGRTRSGNFTPTETITGTPSGATTTVTTAEAFVQARKMTVDDVTSLRLLNNDDFRNNVQSLTSITGYATGSSLVGSATYDPPNLIDGAGDTTTVTVTGAAVGDYAEASFSNDLQGIALSAWVSAANTVSVRFQNETASAILEGSATYDPASLNDGDGATTTVTVTGAALGDFVKTSFSLDLQGITTTAWVSAADIVSVRFQNETGGTIDLGSGTLRARVRPAAGSTINLGSGTLRARVFKP
jgi:hypothetical protein